jgi:Ca2+-binding EF-hand superfamily protein
MDTDGDGAISAEDLAKVMRSLGMQHSQDTINQMIHEVASGDGRVYREQFLKMMTSE